MSFVGLVVLALAVVVGVQAATSVDGESFTSVSRFQRIDPRTISKVEGWKPAWIAATRQATVIVQMAGDPVGKRVGDARSQGKDLTKAQKDAIRADLKNKQDAIKGQIQSAGGTVVGDYQDAYNGIGVRIALKDVSKLGGLPGVTAVRVGRNFRPDNTAGVQYIGGSQAWTGAAGKTGTGVNVAVIDTGVDYLHANFGGPGTKAAFDADNHTIIEPGSFPTAKVVKGTDLVGDNYDSASSDPAKLTRRPDPDPIDCNGHGSHVAGTVAGFGVKDNGSRYTGPYNSSIYGSNNFRIGPGVAPDAKIMAYRVFGCSGSTDEATIVEAINLAVEQGADVINMSLGSPFGRTEEPSAAAADIAAQAGTVVVTSAGNSGPNGYIVGSPSVANRAISVAAVDASGATFPGADIALNTGKTIQAINANNGGPLPGPNTPIVVLRNPDGSVSLGCNRAEYAAAKNAIAVVVRGTCARVARAVFGQQEGAKAVIMINNSSALPPFEGKITGNPDTGEQYLVTIPFLGVKGVLGPAATQDGDDLILATSAVSTTAATVPNTTYQALTSFSSGGPRNVDSAQKPEVSAPGQSVVSTGSGTGNDAATISGTSMASPMTAGAAALVTQAHPSWDTDLIKAALINTAGKAGGPSLNVRVGGAGVVQVQKAVDSKVLALTSGGTGTLSFGYEPLTGAYAKTLKLTLKNTSDAAVSYDLSATGAGLGLVIGFSPSSVTVPGNSSVTVDVNASMSAAAVAALPGMSTFTIGWGGVLTTRGLVLATPKSSGTGIYALRVPWLLAPRGVSNVTAGARSAYTKDSGTEGRYNSSVQLTNNGVHAGTVDLYSWGIHDANDTSGGEDAYDVRDVGVQEQPTEFLTGTPNAADKSVIFAINTYGRWSNAATTEYDIAVDTKGNSAPEFFVVGVDFGFVTTGSFDGRIASFIFDPAGNIIDLWVPDAPMNGSTIELPALASQLGLTTGSNKLNYQVATFPIVPEGQVGDITSVGSFRVGQQPVSTGDFFSLDPGQSRALNLQLDKGKFSGTTVLGWLAVTLDDANGAAQAEEISALPLP
ncbi:MAG: minor extracellular serine protease Vpr [Gaiellaceae bacterium]|jgi:subtilisin family serine protease|nr:minor extracellular serine protease Vpr [Gaiellaceae bacterium]